MVALLGDRVRFDAPLARYASLHVGGPADALALPTSRESVAAVLTLATDAGIPVYVLGGGFNTLVRDEGIRGIVLHLDALRDAKITEEGVRAEAGASHSTVTRLCADNGRAGLEFAVGIPGTVGGWIAMNAGIPDREMQDVLLRLEIALPREKEPIWLDAGSVGFRYRAADLPQGAVVLSALLATDRDEPDRIRERMRVHLEHRRRTQPVDQRSCGSVFKNPPGDHAGRLIDAAGLKGLRVGGAEISTVHANFIVNRGGATAADVLRLMDRAHHEVLRRFDVDLEPEVRVVGGKT